ncbi:sensor domain-containing diguanylate cyclase [Alkalihalophilus marmarensis]|uniref:sensor domain-containing diguanylate cyclase n=1 Tax=Alkalihalophilus marmarensis TaxID=521377 RepID=UPI002DB8356C|nr:sensor domain-containing diguanylate cyclase [Alkalihalophilus marmarensis]MEC2071763.1 sensor domain-containing diguanylate cyclase [Alkalihalophilus marmarensis]
MNPRNEVTVGEIMTVDQWLKGADYQIDFNALASSYHALALKAGKPNHLEKIAIYERNNEQFELVKGEEADKGILQNNKEIENWFKKTHDHSMKVVEGSLITTSPSWNVCISLYYKSMLYGLIIHTFPTKRDADTFAAGHLEMIPFQTLFAQGYNCSKSTTVSMKRDLLLQVTKKCHGSMDINEVLKQIITALNQVFPNWNVHLYLTHEWKIDHDLSIKPLVYGMDNHNRLAEHAYLKGELQIERNEKQLNVFAPLRGKQAVYGVIELEADTDIVLHTHDLEFINVLADTGGNALENAELYQQSRNLNQDLQLINQTSHQLNEKLRLKDTITFMTQQILVSFGAEQVGFVLYEEGEITVLEGSTPVFDDPSLLKKLNPLFMEMKYHREPQFVGDSKSHKLFQHSYYRSLLAVPMIQSGVLKGVVIVLDQKPYRFSYDHFKLLQSLAHHSTLAFTNAMLHEKLEKLVITDHLTSLFSRSYLDQQIRASLENDGYGTYLLFDVDNFKQINDTHGHQIGDEVLIQVAKIMKGNIREEDIAARWGGEELALYLPKVNLEDAKKIAVRIVEAVEYQTEPPITVSCGVSYWHHHKAARSLKELIKEADDGLYTAKRLGKNRIHVVQENSSLKEEA